MSMRSSIPLFRGRAAEVEAAVAAWRAALPQDRTRVFTARCDAQQPTAADLYLLGCAWLRHGDPAAAARAFGPAHHMNWRMESAALLTFACIKASAEPRPMDALPAHVQTTWEEMGKPPLPGSRLERRLVESISAAARAEAFSPCEFLSRLLA